MFCLSSGLYQEELSLCQLLTLGACAEHRFQRIRMESRVPSLGADGHRGRSEVLHLFQVEVQSAGDNGQFGHVLFVTAGVAGYEIGDELLAQACFVVDAVEDALECFELFEGRLAHEVQHACRGMLGSYFEAAADVAQDKFAGILVGCLVCGCIAAAV